MSQVQAGQRINNYLLEEPLGTGSFGQVWRARHHIFDKTVAIKIPTDPEYVNNLRREGVTIHGLRHANIVRALDMDPYDDPPYLIMEYVNGPSLRQVLEKHPQGLPAPVVIRMLRGVLTALSFAHDAGVIHRDVKPANILLNIPLDEIAEVSSENVKVTDFGLGRAGGVTTASIMQSGSMLTKEGKDVAGTLAYMSPEQKEGGPADGRSDIYSCGVVLYELLTGERPQGSDMPSQSRGDVPKYLDDVFARCYTRLDRRFASAALALDALNHESAPPPPPRSVPTEDSPAPGGVLQCPSCHKTIHRDDQYCIYCGKQLVEVVPRCPSCRGFVHHTDKYCIFCGAEINA